MKQNSVIVEFDGRAISGIEQLVELLKYYEPGEKVEVTLEVPDGSGYKEETITVKLDKNTAAQKNNDSKKEDSGENSDEEGQDGSDSILKDWENNMEDSAYQRNFFFGNWR